jgi:hypothetical protein
LFTIVSAPPTSTMKGDDHGVALVVVESHGTHEAVRQAVTNLGLVYVYPFASHLSKGSVGHHGGKRNEQESTYNESHEGRWHRRDEMNS